MATVRQLLTDAHLEIGVLAEGETLSAGQASTSLRTLNRLLDKWGAERLQVFTIHRTTYQLLAGHASYIVGEAIHGNQFADGFDSPWVGVPPGWTPQLIGSGTITNDTTDVQAGGHSVRLSSATFSVATFYRDFYVLSGSTVELDVWSFAGFTNLGFLRVQNRDTGNYYDGATQQWTGASAAVFESAAGIAFVQETNAITIESEAATGAFYTTIRVIMENGTLASGFDAWFDTFSLTNALAVGGTRPPSIDHINVLDPTLSPELEIPMSPLTDDQWALLPQKDMQSTFPTRWHYNPTMPAGTLSVWPVPTGDSYQLALYIPVLLSQYSDLNDEVVLPPGYEEMLVSNLAVRLCPSYQVQASPALVEAARDSMATVKRANHRISDLGFDGGALIGAGSGYWDTSRFRSGP